MFKDETPDIWFEGKHCSVCNAPISGGGGVTRCSSCTDLTFSRSGFRRYEKFAAAKTGCVRPIGWRMCPVCKIWFPLIISKKDPATCSHLTDSDCSSLLRKKFAAESKATPSLLPSGNKYKDRATVCRRKQGLCPKYDGTCNGKYGFKPPDAYPDCYEPPREPHTAYTRSSPLACEYRILVPKR